MKFHGITCTGKFQLKKVDILPAWVEADEGGLIYDTVNKELYLGTDVEWVKASGGGGYGVPVTDFTDNDIMDSGKMYLIDTTGDALTGRLNPTPRIGDIITVVDIASMFGMYSFTIEGNGNNIHQDTSLEADVKDLVLVLIYTGIGWKIDVGGLVTGSGGGMYTFGEYDSDFTAFSNLVAFVDTRAGEVVITLPDEAGGELSSGVSLTVYDQYNTFNVNKCTVITYGATLENGNTEIDLTTDGNKTVFTWNAGPFHWKVEQDDIGIGNLVWTDTNYNASNGDFVFIDSRSNPINITLPPTGDIRSKAHISIYDEFNAFNLNNVTVTPAFGTINQEVNYTATEEGSRVDFIWDDQQDDWKLDVGGANGGGGSGGIGGGNPVSINSNYTAHLNDFIFADTTGGAITVTLPNADYIGTGKCISVYDVKAMFGTNNLTIIPVNATINTDTSFEGDIDNLRIDLIYNDDENDWKLDIGGALITGTSGGGSSSPTASETQYGVVQLATEAEVNAGTEEYKVVTPKTLDSVLGDTITTINESLNWNMISVATSGEINKKYMVDTSSGPFIFTLPSTANNGEAIRFADGGDFSINNLTISRNGNTIEGLAEDMIVTIPNVSFEMVFHNNDWQIA